MSHGGTSSDSTVFVNGIFHEIKKKNNLGSRILGTFHLKSTTLRRLQGSLCHIGYI